MIFIDSREDIAISGTVRVDGLEAQTGADIMLSRLAIPCKTRALLDKHIESGAILVQLKIGEDLAGSIGDRLNDSLARMRSITKRTASHLLLFIGTLDCGKDGEARINGRKTHSAVSFASLDGAIVGWLARGGVYYSIPRLDMLDAWAHAMERRLAEYDAQVYKYAFNQQEMPDDLDTPLQIPVRVTDARRVLIGFRGLGPELVNRVWKYCGDFKSSLAFLTDPASAGKVEDVGVKTIASIRRQCGLTESDSYIGWGHDAVDAKIPKRFTNLTPVPRTTETIAKDTADLFGKQKVRTP